MTKYTETIYPRRVDTYTPKLISYLYDRFMSSELTLLDVGCGNGTHINEFLKLGINAFGIDKRKETESKRIKICDIERDRFPFESNTFDIIFSKSLIEHIGNPEHFLSESRRVLKDNGLIIIMTPEWRSQLKHFWDDYTHVHPYTRKSLRDCLTINNFRNAECEIFYQLPFIWKYPYLKFIPIIISILPDFLKWKTKEERNGEDRKLIRFSKERMLLAYAYK